MGERPNHPFSLSLLLWEPLTGPLLQMALEALSFTSLHRRERDRYKNSPIGARSRAMLVLCDRLLFRVLVCLGSRQA